MQDYASDSHALPLNEAYTVLYGAHTQGRLAAFERTWRERTHLLTAADRIALGFAVALVALVAVRWRNYQWDFYMFYGSAVDAMHGLSPYRGSGLSFYHPPLALLLYGLFVRLPFPVAYELWLALKLAALGGLFLVWKRHFIRLDAGWRTTLYFILAYNGTIYSDLVAGNVSTFEQLGLWLGFAALLEGRYARFCALLILVAQFKLTPILFASLFLIVPVRPQWRWFAICLAGFALIFSLNYLAAPVLMRDFLRVAPALDERGTLAPGALAFIRDLLDSVYGAGFSDATHTDEALFVLGVTAVALLSLLTVVRGRRRGVGALNPKVTIYFTCVAYAIAVPRMRVYSYILLLVPTLYLLRAFAPRWRVPVAAATIWLLVLFPHSNSLLPMRSLSHFLYQYLPLAAAVGVWLGLRQMLSSDRASHACDEDVLSRYVPREQTTTIPVTPSSRDRRFK
jgi:hypothetical protein